MNDDDNNKQCDVRVATHSLAPATRKGAFVDMEHIDDDMSLSPYTCAERTFLEWLTQNIDVVTPSSTDCDDGHILLRKIYAFLQEKENVVSSSDPLIASFTRRTQLRWRSSSYCEIVQIKVTPIKETDGGEVSIRVESCNELGYVTPQYIGALSMCKRVVEQALASY